MAARTRCTLAGACIGAALACSRAPGAGKNPEGPDSGALGRSGSGGSTAGNAGVGGTGGSAGSGGTAPFDAAGGGLDAGSSGWLGSTDAWQRVDAPACELYAAIKEKLPVLRREWTACGPGCLSAPAVAPIGVARERPTGVRSRRRSQTGKPSDCAR
jgi:hypothetical protein